MNSEAPASAEPIRPLIPYGWLRALIFMICTMIILVVAQIGAQIFFGPGGDMAAFMASPQMAITQVISLIVTVLLAWLFAIVVDRRPLIEFGFRLSPRFRRDLLAGIAWGVGAVTVVFLVLWIGGYIVVTAVNFPWQALAIMAISIAFAASQEEVLLRGYVLNNVLQSTNRWVALGIVSLVFALVHGSNPNVGWLALVNIVLAGLFLGVYYIHRGNLWFPIGLHIAWNYLQGPILGSPVSGLTLPSVLQLEFQGNELITGGAFGFEASLVTTVVMIGATVCVHLIYRPRAEAPKASEIQPPPTST
jgi:membrane protease YdiL (CAAX protease family)